MNARQLVNELRCEGVELEASGGQIVVRGDAMAFTATMRAKVIALKPELLALLQPTGTMSEAEYERAALECHRRCLTHLGRAYGYSESMLAIAREWLAACPKGGTFHVGARRIRIDLHHGGVAYLRHPSADSPRGAGMDP
jgi:hypothetical protein